MSAIFSIPLRAFQLAFAAIVTGLSISLAKGHHWGAVPITLGYVSFVGCVSLLGAFAGLAAIWVEFLGGPIGMIIDGIVMLLNLAGGILVAVELDGVKCGSDTTYQDARKMGSNGLMNGGFRKGTCYYCQDGELFKTLVSRCKMDQADAAFMFLTFIVLIGALALSFMRSRKTL